MNNLKADFLSNIDQSLWALSIDETHALVSIAGDITGIPLTIVKKPNSLHVWVDGAYFTITPVYGSHIGVWSADNATDALIVDPFPNSAHHTSFEVSLSEGLKGCNFVFMMIEKCIMRLHNPFARTANKPFTAPVIAKSGGLLVGVVDGEVER